MYFDINDIVNLGVYLDIQDVQPIIHRFLFKVRVNDSQAVVLAFWQINHRPQECDKNINIALVAEDELKDKIRFRTGV